MHNLPYNRGLLSYDETGTVEPKDDYIVDSQKIRFGLLRPRIICAALLFVTVNAHAENWVVFGSGHVSVNEYDKDSIVRNKGLVKAWVRETFAIPQPSPLSGRPITTDLMRFTIDCRARTIAHGDYVSYNEGAIVDSVHPTSVQVDDIVPGSLGEGLRNSICPQ